MPSTRPSCVTLMPMDAIRIRGARNNNLKNISVDIPRNRLTVITGVSGSGKSSLAFDTLFAEAYRRFVEAISVHGWHNFQRMDAPDVDEIQGLCPAIAVRQNRFPPDPRSTVGTITEIQDHLRLLFAKLGVLHCPSCGKPVRAFTIREIVEDMMEQWEEGSRLLLISPMKTVGEKELPTLLKKLQREGFARVRLDEQIRRLDSNIPVPRRSTHKVDVVVDRVVLDRTRIRRLSESVELALTVGEGLVGVVDPDGSERLYSETFRCTDCRLRLVFPSVNGFSFRHPEGMCPHCKGLGFLPAARARGTSGRDALSHGTWEGLDDPVSPEVLDLEFVPQERICPGCNGTRLNESARGVRLGGLGIHEVCGLALPGVRKWLMHLEFTETQHRIAARPMRELLQRLANLEELGLEYLSLERSARSLSGGEVQRIRLAAQLSGSLSGVVYVLDEPSVGLHAHDMYHLLSILRRLREMGNTVVVVEHDRQTVVGADYVIDMGPGAGEEGGGVVFAGAPEMLLKEPCTLTGLYLSGRKSVQGPGFRRKPASGFLSVMGATGHNLRGIDAHFPIGCLTCVTGVSGSGKSTLVLHTLYRAMAARLHGSRAEPAPHREIVNGQSFRRTVLVDQAPIGRTCRSTPATYIGVFAQVRELFSRLPESKARGYGAGRFSFNARGGRCETCMGEGVQKIEMVFLPDVFVTCPACKGSRYNGETLEIKFKGSSIHDVLQMTVQEACQLFVNIPAIRQRLETMMEVGLGYLRMGQPGPSLSGGEAQRMKLAGELCRKSAAQTLYILDEPTTGLHLEDIRRLLHLLQNLVNQGHTVIVVEHSLEVISAADHVIDLGPGGGDAGGSVVAAGTPEEIAKTEASITGRYLRVGNHHMEHCGSLNC